ncbi:MAG: hypothetical protein KF729_23635 [Sandaracinaceae bacterium]|nr:hypothetical protein [Sandaracinaceae bacterium]
MRRAAHRVRHLALTLGLVALAGPARAHGPAPVALEVLAHDGRAPLALRTSVGLAVARGDGTYAYVCPARWDGNELALAAGARDGRDLLVHSAGAAYLSRDGGCTFAPLTDGSLYVMAAASTGQGFLLVAEDASASGPRRSRLFEVSDGVLEELPLALPGAVDGALGIPGGWLVAGHAPVGFVAGPDGVLATFETSASWITPRALDAGDLWLRVAGADGVILARVGAGEVELTAPSARLVGGPIRLDGRWLALLDGALHAFEDGAWHLEGELPWTCLQSYEGRHFACGLEALWELAPGAPVPAAVAAFSFSQLAPPDACGEPATRAACGREWAHFGGEAGWLDAPPATRPGEPRGATPGSGDGCAASSTPPRGSLALVVALAAFASARSRRAMQRASRVATRGPARRCSS